MANARMCFTKRSLSGRVLCVDDYKLGQVLGVGVAGKVRVAELGQGSQTFAVKVINIRESGNEAAQRAQATLEASMLALCGDHPHILGLHDFLQTTSGKMYIVSNPHVTDLARNGDLFDAVISAPKRALAGNLVKTVMQQLLSAVAHIHAKNVAHRDIKPENILMMGPSCTALGDFGAAVHWREGDELLSDAVGTIRCLPPEMFLKRDGNGGRAYDPKKADIWACGVVLYFLLAGQFPFDEGSPTELAEAIVSRRFTYGLPDRVDPAAKDLLDKMLHQTDECRPTAKELLGHSFLATTRQASM